MGRSRHKNLTDKNAPLYDPENRYPVEDLGKYFMTHRRLRVFAIKGCTCVECGIEGTHLRLRVDTGGGRHVDLFTETNVLMTIDHINPRANGGSSHIDNLQPMCTNCNRKKAHTVEPDAVFTQSQIKDTPESKEPELNRGEWASFELSFKRPKNFFKLPMSEQWEIDKQLGLLDWDGGCGHHGYKSCFSCRKLMDEYYER